MGPLIVTGERPLRLAVFDMDGTLIDSQDLIVTAMQEAFDGVGLPAPDRVGMLSVVGLSLPLAMEVLVPEAGAAAHADLTARYRAAFLRQREEMGAEAMAPLYPGARAALERLAAQDDLLLGVATGKARRGLNHTLTSHDLGRFFHTTQTADDHPSKPDPSMLMRCLAETGADAGRAVMIGDTDFDIRMGRAAGFATIGVAWGYHPVARLEAAGADIVIGGFAELDAALDRLLGIAA